MWRDDAYLSPEDHAEIHCVVKPRSGWAEKFEAMAQAGDDKLADEEVTTTWDDEEWEY